MSEPSNAIAVKPANTITVEVKGVAERGRFCPDGKNPISINNAIEGAVNYLLCKQVYTHYYPNVKNATKEDSDGIVKVEVMRFFLDSHAHQIASFITNYEDKTLVVEGEVFDYLGKKHHIVVTFKSTK